MTLAHDDRLAARDFSFARVSCLVREGCFP